MHFDATCLINKPNLSTSSIKLSNGSSVRAYRYNSPLLDIISAWSASNYSKANYFQLILSSWDLNWRHFDWLMHTYVLTWIHTYGHKQLYTYFQNSCCWWLYSFIRYRKTKLLVCFKTNIKYILEQIIERRTTWKYALNQGCSRRHYF